MTDFELFISRNNLQKKDIAAYLGVSASFITQLCQGRRGLPIDKLALLKRNPHGWDVSMLTEERGSIIAGNNNGGDVNVQIGRNRSAEGGSSVREAVLEKENEMLRERLKDKDEQIELLKSLIRSK